MFLKPLNFQFLANQEGNITIQGQIIKRKLRQPNLY